MVVLAERHSVFSSLLSKEDVAQMVERSLCMREARGSIPRISNLTFKLQLIFKAQMVERSLCMREARGSIPRISKF
ncbi:hypothetical protein CR513_40689, partial [Mucuna pruriens]